MDNYDLSNLSPSGHCADSGEHHPRLTEEQSGRATFSKRSATFSTLDQAGLQQLSLTHEEQFSEQRVLADFNISLLPNTPDRATFDEPGDPFAELAAYQPLTFDDNPQHPSVSELGLSMGLFEDLTAQELNDLVAEELTDVVAAQEPEGNDVFEQSGQPEKSQSESDTHGIIIPESTTPDTVSEKLRGKRRALEPGNVPLRGISKSSIERSIELRPRKSPRRSKRLPKKRQKLDSTDLETSQKHTRRQDPDEILQERVNKETEKWIVKREGVEKRYMCSYPNCGYTFVHLCHLKTHIFRHTHISTYKCTYPGCSDSKYFRNITDLQRHVRKNHTYEEPYSCELCIMRFGRSDSYKRHMRIVHKL